MKTSNINVRDMLSVWSVEETEKHISDVPGVESVTLNYATGNATVRYDETHLDVADIKSAVRQRGYESFEQEHSTDKPSEEKNEATATPLSTKPPEINDKPEAKSPAKSEGPNIDPSNGTIIQTEKDNEKLPSAQPAEVSDKRENKSPAKTEDPKVPPPKGRAKEPEKGREEEKDKAGTKPPGIGKKEEDNAGHKKDKM